MEGAFHIFQTGKHAKLNQEEPKREEAGQVPAEFCVLLFTPSGQTVSEVHRETELAEMRTSVRRLQDSMHDLIER